MRLVAVALPHKLQHREQAWMMNCTAPASALTVRVYCRVKCDPYTRYDYDSGDARTCALDKQVTCDFPARITVKRFESDGY